jgi:membrane-associated phospholipid phosphatase
MAIYAHGAERFTGDLSVSLWLQSVGGEPWYSAMLWLSYVFGSWRGGLLVILLTSLIWRWLGRREAIFIFLAGVMNFANLAVKVLVNQPRPSPNLVQVFVHEQGLGFPSGHAFFSIVLLGLLAYFLYTRLTDRFWQILGVVSLAAVILLVGVSRVYLGVHWASEVIGGYLTGGIFLGGLIWGYAEMHWRAKPAA